MASIACVVTVSQSGLKPTLRRAASLQDKAINHRNFQKVPAVSKWFGDTRCSSSCTWCMSRKRTPTNSFATGERCWPFCVPSLATWFGANGIKRCYAREFEPCRGRSKEGSCKSWPGPNGEVGRGFVTDASGLANSMGLFLQKTNIIRDYLEDYAPVLVW